MRIEVKDLRAVEKGALKGFCTVVFADSGLEFRDMRIIQQGDQKAFVVGPQREYEKDGQKKYVSLVFWPKGSKLGEAIQKAVLDEWERNRPQASTRGNGGYSNDIPF